MIGVGIAWASILSMPYAILTGSLPPSKMGYYMGVFNFFIVIPQIVAAALLGFLVGRFFDGQPIYALAIGGASLLLAAALTLRVEDRDDVARSHGHAELPSSSCLALLAGCRASAAEPPTGPARADPGRATSGTAPRSTSCSPTASPTGTLPTTTPWAGSTTARCCAASRVATSRDCCSGSSRDTSIASG